jgi:hypothetical protein
VSNVITLDRKTRRVVLDRGEVLLEFIEDEVRQRLNPDNEDCWHCGGEGETFDCIDGCCLDADSGCELCKRDCLECRINEITFKKSVRIEVLRTLDIDIAIAWLKSRDKWSDRLTRHDVLLNLHSGRVATKEFTPEERAASACWVEGLL